MPIFTEIKISGIPNKFPANYYDYLSIDDREYHKPELKVIDFETSELYESCHELGILSTKRIQSIAYDCYYVTAYANENINIDLIKLAQFITVKTKDNKTINAKLLQPITYEKIENSTQYRCNIQFYDLKINLDSITNYLTYPENLYTNVIGNLYRLELASNVNFDNTINFAGGTKLNFYTCLKPKLDFTPEKYETVNATFYLKESEMLQLKRYCSQCQYNENSLLTGVRLYVNGTTYTAIEPVVPIIEKKELYDIYECKIELKYFKQHITGLTSYVFKFEVGGYTFTGIETPIFDIENYGTENELSKSLIICKLVLNETDKNILKRYSRITNSYQAISSQYIAGILTYSSTYLALEPINFEEKYNELSKLYDVTIKITYNFNDMPASINVANLTLGNTTYTTHLTPLKDVFTYQFNDYFKNINYKFRIYVNETVKETILQEISKIPYNSTGYLSCPQIAKSVIKPITYNIEKVGNIEKPELLTLTCITEIISPEVSELKYTLSDSNKTFKTHVIPIFDTVIKNNETIEYTYKHVSQHLNRYMINMTFYLNETDKNALKVIGARTGLGDLEINDLIVTINSIEYTIKEPFEIEENYIIDLELYEVKVKLCYGIDQIQHY